MTDPVLARVAAIRTAPTPDLKKMWRDLFGTDAPPYKVHAILQENPRTRANKTRRREPALLRGLLFGPSGLAMTPTHTRRKGKLYRYYVTTSVLKLGPESCPIRRVSATEIEHAVIDQLRGLLRAPEIFVRTWTAVNRNDAMTEAEVREACEQLDPLWDELFPAEQARIVQLLVERIDVRTDGVAIRFRTEGLASLVAEMQSFQAPNDASLERAAGFAKSRGRLPARVA